MKRRNALGLLWQLPIVWALGCRKQADASPTKSVRIGLAVNSQVHALAWIAKDQGFFEKEALAAQIEVMGGSAAAIRTLVAGKLDVALAGGDAVLKASWAGAELAVIGGLVERFYHRIVGKSVGSIAELRGKKIGVPFLGGPQEICATYALAKADLKPGRDVELVVLGTETNMIGALERGDVDATTSDLSKAKLEKMGLRVLADLPADPQPFPYLIVVARKDLVKNDRPLVKATLTALCRATRFYQDPKNQDASLAVVRKRIPGTEMLDGPNALKSPPVPSREAFETAIELAGKGDAEKSALHRILELGIVNEIGSCS